jgi:RimJ/RimL family protein N-acetyltransferase
MTVHPGTIEITDRVITTDRLRLRPWTVDDAEAAYAVFGDEQVARWLAPAMDQVSDVEEMRGVLLGWVAADGLSERATGRWAIEELATGSVVGGVTLRPMPPHGEDLEIGWQLAPDAWGRGLASEAGHALAHFAFGSGEDEVFAVVRPRNTRGAATAERVGMEWVGETDKYYDLRLRVFRLRKSELDIGTV